MIETSTDAVFDVQVTKTILPDHVVEHVGYIIDTVSRELKISEERMTEIKRELNKLVGRSQCTKRELLSIVGKLQFCSKVVILGHMFTRCLIHLSKKPKELYHKVTLTNQAKADIMWWYKCMDSHNGVSMIRKPWNINSTEIIFTDASDVAVGVLHRLDWAIEDFTGPNTWISISLYLYLCLYLYIYM